jgi:hypothetical protein
MNQAPPAYKVIRLDGFSPSWIGTDPFKPGFAVGSDSGIVAFTDEGGVETIDRYPLSESGESINGVAGFGDYLAVSTRHEVTIFGFPPGPKGPVNSAVISRGSHGIIASTESGQFLAPIGHDGIMVVTPTVAAVSQNRINSFPGTSVNFYRLCELPAADNRLRFIAACRSAGVGLLDVSKENGEIGLVVGRFAADIVDVAYLGTPDYPHAVAAAGLGGELLLCRDIVRQEPPISMHYEGLVGRIYRVFSGHGHLFLLTGRAIYVLGGLAKRLVAREFDNKRRTPIMTLPMRAVDAAIVNNKWLLTVMPEEIHRYDLAEIDQRISNFEIEDSNWEFAEPPPQSWSVREIAEVASV